MFSPAKVEIKVRAKPHLSSRVIGSLERGMVVHCGAVLNDWLQVCYNMTKYARICHALNSRFTIIDPI